VKGRRHVRRMVLSLLLLGSAAAEPRRDPLTQPEIDQLRDTAQDPDLRLKLYVDFARSRLTALEQMRSDPKVTDRAQQTHDRLQDFVDVYDELNDNIDTYAARKSDLRRVLKTIIEADNEFQAKLRALKESAETNAADAKLYDFVLTDAIADVNSSIPDHRQLLQEQEEAAKRKKLVKP